MVHILVVLTFNVRGTLTLNVRIVKKENAKKILFELEAGYDLIADKFSSTRAFMWRDLGFVTDLVKPGDRVLDFGCGNGRLAGFMERVFREYFGVDVSQKLIDMAEKKYNEKNIKFLKIDPLVDKLTFADNSFDIIFSIAVFHHLPGKEYRLRVAKELYRVLRPGGKLVVSVWNLWQRRFWKYHWQELLRKLGKSGKSSLNWGDLKIPFKAGDKVFERYHHAFGKRELKKLFLKSKFKSGNFVKSKRGNIIFVAEK
jgi:SAM-dependent methyltransferase